jgi:pyruvate dehydrogenase E2 component (dihydrolipoamide acetyltransferase)
MKKEVKIPDIAENVETGVIAGILVSEGDKVSEDQPLVEIETDKATTDLPSPYEGVIDEIKISEGDEVKVNQVIMIIETGGDDDEEKGKSEDKKEGEKKGGDRDEGKEKEDKKEKESVKEVETEEEDKKEEEGKKEEDEDEDEKEAVEDDEKKEKDSGKSEDKNEAKTETHDLSDIPASPSVRRMAREMGVDLTKVEGSGPGNRISAEDIKKYAERPEDEPAVAKEVKLPDFSKWGAASTEDMSRIRSITAKNVTQSWQTIPHVTQYDEADMTNLENFRNRFQEIIEKEGGKLTVTAILLKIVSFALQKFPQFNASLDYKNEKIIFKHYFNIGIAVDTPQGLLVPVIHDVNKKSLKELSVELTEVAKKARDKKISPDELQGGNFTISNLGGIGGTAFSPVIFPPQVAILGISRAQHKPIYIDDDLKKRLIIPLSLSYDHRVIDGADGARFLRWICDVIEDPYSILQ